MSTSDEGYKIAMEEAQQGLAEGGIPIGASVISPDGKILGRGRNTRIQNGSRILHGETAAFDADRELPSSAYEGSTLYTTLSPCPMCAGAAIWFKVKRVVIADNVHMTGREELLRNSGVEVIVLNDEPAVAMMRKYVESNPEKMRGIMKSY